MADPDFSNAKFPLIFPTKDPRIRRFVTKVELFHVEPLGARFGVHYSDCGGYVFYLEWLEPREHPHANGTAVDEAE